MTAGPLEFWFVMQKTALTHAARCACLFALQSSLDTSRDETLLSHTKNRVFAWCDGRKLVGCCSFDISVRAGPLDVVHYTVDPDDPSNGVCLSMAMGAWQGNMLMNQPSPRQARPGASTAEQKRYAMLSVSQKQMQQGLMLLCSAV